MTNHGGEDDQTQQSSRKSIGAWFTAKPVGDSTTPTDGEEPSPWPRRLTIILRTAAWAVAILATVALGLTFWSVFFEASTVSMSMLWVVPTLACWALAVVMAGRLALSTWRDGLWNRTTDHAGRFYLGSLLLCLLALSNAYAVGPPYLANATLESIGSAMMLTAVFYSMRRPEEKPDRC